VVFDRIRENLKNLKRQSFDYASMINRSINETLSRTIITSGTTLLVVLVLYFFGGEVLKDFAFALICGILIGTYSSIFVASPILVEFEFRKKTS
jgi:preprotein translocase subunit SecF